MNPFLQDRISRKLETLSDERVYQILDYIEFLESKYAERKPASPGVFQRFAEGVEDTMRAGKVSATTVAETMSLMTKAMGVLSGVAAAGKSVATDLVGGGVQAAEGIAAVLTPDAAKEPAKAPATEPPPSAQPNVPPAGGSSSPGSKPG
ncbi:MAG: DUF2281 domain-containing protein [Gemmatimonadetes bacterium]|nr:DUF2281 domain-containing protein [Gemmatimonadota bacterium]